MTQPNEAPVDVNDVIDEMANQVANLTRQNAILAARLKAALGTAPEQPAEPEKVGEPL